MILELNRFFQACNPNRTLGVSNAQDRKYYIDFSSVRGGKIIDELRRTITDLSPDQRSCQLFTGHIGCGKSTELLRLKHELEALGFHVVYFESSQDLVMADVDITDILMAIAHKVSKSLEQARINLQPRGLQALLQKAVDFLRQVDVSLDGSIPGIGNFTASTEGELSLSLLIGKITAKTKNSTELRSQLREHLEPRTETLLQAINQELLEPAVAILQQQGKKGLIVIVDNLDRVDDSLKPNNRTQPEYLFVDRGEQLKQLNCHVVYTIPLVLIFSNDFGRLRNRFGINPKVLPMVRERSRNSHEFEQGMTLLQQMVLARAFPDIEPQQRLSLIPEVFDSPKTLNRLCRVSGGHVRNLLVLLYSCLQKQDPPISRNCLEQVIQTERDILIRAIDKSEWELLSQVEETGNLTGEEEYRTLLRSLFVFEYQDEQGVWFGINPILAEAKQLQS